MKSHSAKTSGINWYRKYSKRDCSLALGPQCSTALRPRKSQGALKYFCWTENMSLIKTWVSLVHFSMAYRALSMLWLVRGASPSASSFHPATDPAFQELLPFNPGYPCVQHTKRKEPENMRVTGKVHSPSSSKREGSWLEPGCHTCMLPAPGLGRSSSGFILERLLCMGSPVLLTADSLVGLFCCRQVGWFFFPQKKTKLDCDKYVTPNKNKQHLLGNFAWRSCIVNYTGYAITLFFDYIALTHGRAALLNLVAAQRGSGK